MSLDVACAILHLHSEQLLHGDLKANNVLLARGGSGGTLSPSIDDISLAGAVPQGAATAAVAAAGGSAEIGAGAGRAAAARGVRLRDLIANQQPRLVAKVSDFGLSLALDTDVSHVSHMHGVSIAGELLL
jgi:serine/threonine protein kinase